MSAWSNDLGRELREAPIPSHRSDHFERVREGIREAADDDGCGGPHPKPPLLPRHGLRPARWSPRVFRLAAVAAVAAAIAAAIAVSWSGVPGFTASTPAPATADTVLAQVQDALADLGSISGDVIEYGTARGRPSERRVGSFTFTARGDYRITQTGQGVAYTYDARARVARRYTYRDGRILYSEVARDLPDPGPFFSPWMGVSQVLDRSVAAYARAVIAELDPDVPVSPATYEGRTAWSLTVPERLSGGGGDGSVHIIVDAESGYPLVVEHWTAGGDVSGTRIENVRVGGDLPRSAFSLRTDAKHRLLPMSERFRRMSLRQAAALGRRLRVPGAKMSAADNVGRGKAGFTPYATVWVPEGYRLSGVSGAVNGAYMGASRPADDGRIGSLTVVLTYRRGFDRFCIVSRWRRDDPPGSDDPFDEDSAALTESTEVPVTYGSLRGEMASVVLGLPDWPHLYASTGRDDRVTVSVAGDLTRDELVRIADSLRPIAE